MKHASTVRALDIYLNTHTNTKSIITIKRVETLESDHHVIGWNRMRAFPLNAFHNMYAVIITPPSSEHELHECKY